jgi:hypothetical protein
MTKMIMHSKSAALAAPAIRWKYTGKYAYASLKLTVSSPTAPVLALGVSDTDQAAAVTAEQTVITGNGTLNLRDVVESINNWLDTTAARAVLQGDFRAELANALYSDIFGGTATPFETAAGTLNGKNTWQDGLIVDDNAEGFGYTSLMLAPYSMGLKGPVVLKEITGVPGTSGTPTVTRNVYDQDGNLLATSGSIATATAALLLAALPAWGEPVILGNGPIVIRDTCATAAHNTGTTMRATYGFPSAKNF